MGFNILAVSFGTNSLLERGASFVNKYPEIANSVQRLEHAFFAFCSGDPRRSRSGKEVLKAALKCLKLNLVVRATVLRSEDKTARRVVSLWRRFYNNFVGEVVPRGADPSRETLGEIMGLAISRLNEFSLQAAIALEGSPRQTGANEPGRALEFDSPHSDDLLSPVFASSRHSLRLPSLRPESNQESDMSEFQ